MNKVDSSSVIEMKNQDGLPVFQKRNIYVGSIQVHCERIEKALLKVVSEAIQDRRDLAMELGVQFNKEELVILRDVLLASFLLVVDNAFQEKGNE